MATKKFLTNEGLAYFLGKLKEKFVTKQTGYSLVSDTEIAKLATVEENANYITQGTNVTIEEGVVSVATATDSELGVVKAGTNVTITEGAVNVATAAIGTAGVVALSSAIDNTSETIAATSKAVKDAVDEAKSYADGIVSSAIHYKGSVTTYAELPSENNTVGDMYNVETADPTHDVKAGDNVVYVETDEGVGSWDVLSGIVDLSDCVKVTDIVENSDIDTMFNNAFPVTE